MNSFVRQALLAFSAISLLCSCGNGKDIRLLYWNIQNGMWSDQGNNYDNFVDFVKSQDPDVCVWCEAKTHYKTDSAESFKPDDDLYLTSHWDELAARYGHKYVFVGGENDFFPQVITSKYPIDPVARITGSRDSVWVSHGAGWATIKLGGKKVNFVTLHTWPQKYYYGLRYNTPKEVQDSSIANHGGDRFRAKEMKFICDTTIANAVDADSEYWLMMGDFNAKTRLDNYHYGWPADTAAFWVHDIVLNETPYLDILAEKKPGEFHPTHANNTRIDFVYASKAALDCVTDINVLSDGWVEARRHPEVNKFFTPSDHLPIVVDFRF